MAHGWVPFCVLGICKPSINMLHFKQNNSLTLIFMRCTTGSKLDCYSYFSTIQQALKLPLRYRNKGQVELYLNFDAKYHTFNHIVCTNTCIDSKKGKVNEDQCIIVSIGHQKAWKWPGFLDFWPLNCTNSNLHPTIQTLTVFDGALATILSTFEMQQLWHCTLNLAKNWTPPLSET